MNFKYTKRSWMVIMWLLLPLWASSQTITGLNDWRLFLDPGHAQKENMGLYNYSEAEKVLRVALALRTMLTSQTDIAEVYMCRLTDEDQISLEARTDLANTLGADFYYSIHSDAGSPSANSALMLYGGWRSNGMTVEKTPAGGAALGEILNADLPEVMRIPTRGNWADRNFYLGIVDNHTNQWPYLHVNRTTNMASLLSEAGFHTNPKQQQLNLNAQWKELEALAAFRSILEYHQIDRPAIGIATGIITDADSGLPVNGATVTIGANSYTTDSYESLFKNYSTDPQELRNGFYWISGLTPGSEVEVAITAPGYEPASEQLTIVSQPNGRTLQNLSVLDVTLTSLVPPMVESVNPADQLSSLVPSTGLLVRFNRKMDRASVESSVSIDPVAPLSFSWIDDFTLEINTTQLTFLTQYQVTLDGALAKNSLTGQLLDGDADGVAGGNFQFSFTTSPEDTQSPELIDFSPNPAVSVQDIRPVIRLVYDEVIKESSLNAGSVTLVLQGGAPVEGEILHQVVNGQSVIHFFPASDLLNHGTYRVDIAGGLSDEVGNLTDGQSFLFYMAESPLSGITLMDSFDAINNWWEPQASGSTAGIVTLQTSRVLNQTTLNKVVPTTGSLQLNYGWDVNHAAPYIRLYLPPAAVQNAVKFNASHVLQVYMFGDGSNNQFRFMIRDGNNTLEGSQWFTINWLGWKLVSWDLTNDQAFGWVNGNGVLDGSNFYLDGLHFRYVAGANPTGTLYFEDLRFVNRQPVDYPTTLFESFEYYDDFTTNLYPWTTVDVKGDITWNPQGFTFPGSGQPYAFRVLNPYFTEGPIVANHPAQHGDKYLIAMQSQTIEDDKWLVSPVVRITNRSVLKCFARSISDAWGLERFQVLVTENVQEPFLFNTENFTKISEGDYLEAPLNWTPFEFPLESYAGKEIRFAIRGVSYDSYMLMLDAIELYQTESTSVETPKSASFRLYPNPAADQVSVYGADPVTEIRVVDLSGTTVKVIRPVSLERPVSVGDLSPGIYLFNVVSDHAIQTIKVVIKR